MNTNPEILDLHDHAANPQSSAAPQTRPGRTRRRRTGKVACLPKAARDLINSGLDDGVTYLKIIENLGPVGVGLTANNLSEWKDGGYQDYLQDKFWRDEMRARQETFTDLLAGSDALKLPEAGLQLAATSACELLRDLSELDASPDGKIDPNQFVRVANSLSRLSRSILTLQEYRDAAAKAETLKLKILDKDREYAQTERTALLDAADDLFGFKSHLRLQAEALTAAAATPVPSPAETEPTASPVAPKSNEGGSSNLQPATSNLQPIPPPSEEPALVAPEPHESGPSIPQPESSIPQPESSIPQPESSIPQPESSIPQPVSSIPQSEHCLACHTPLAPLLPNGHRPATACPSCGVLLPPPGTSITPSLEHCPHCDIGLPRLLPDGQRPRNGCLRCNEALPPPGTAIEQLADHCPECGTRLSSNPYAMAVYGGDVGLDEFAKHSNAKLLWEIAQGRVTWAGDLAVWSSHDGQDTLFNQFAQQARVGAKPWNLYYRVTIPDAIELGLLDVINRTQNTRFTPQEFLADCKARAGSEEVYEQAYLCNPMGAATSHIVEYSAIELCRYDYQITRLHLEQDQILQQFGPFRPDRQEDREDEIKQFIYKKFYSLFQSRDTHRLGFDVAASGQGDLAVIYIDERKGSELWLRGLFSCRTEDWNFLYTVLATFLREIKKLKAVGDESGLGRQICWEAAQRFRGRFSSVNFSSKKHDLGFALMNQLATAQKRFPRSEQDIAADYFALRRAYQGTRWVFSESPNSLNPASHCDIAWAGGLATEAHFANKCEVWAVVG